MRVFTTSGVVRRVMYSPDASLVVSVEGDGLGIHQIVGWDLSESYRAWIIPVSTPVPDIAVALARRSPRVACPEGGAITLRTPAHQMIQRIQVAPYTMRDQAVALTTDGETVALSGTDNSPLRRSEIAVMRLDQPARARGFRSGAQIRSLQFHPSGDF